MWMGLAGLTETEMTEQYKLNSNELRLKVFLEKAEELKNSFKKGDYLRIYHMTEWNSDLNRMELRGNNVQITDLMKKTTEVNAVRKLCNYDSEKEEQLSFHLLYQVIDVVSGFPILKVVPFNDCYGHRDEDDHENLVEILERALNDAEYELRNYSGIFEEHERFEAELKNVANTFCVLDDDYADSMLLDGEFIPYQREQAKFDETKELIEKEMRKIRENTAKKAAETRAEKKRKQDKHEHKVVDFEFRDYLEQLEIEELFEQLVED